MMNTGEKIALAGVIIAVVSLIAFIVHSIYFPPPPPPVTPTPSPTPTPDVISGTYLMDHQSNRIITIKHLGGNNYRVGESTSPWPWTGTVTVNEVSLSGSGMFIDSEASMKLEGFIQEDRSIVIQYKFITDPDRIDSHVWYPVE